MLSANKKVKIERKRPLRSQWETQNKSHTGKPNHREFARSKRDPEAAYA